MQWSGMMWPNLGNRPARSALVTTAATPGADLASSACTAMIRACARSERTTWACSMPSSARSTQYLAAPVTFSAKSVRRTLRPACRRLLAVSALMRPPGRYFQDGLDDRLVASAPADVALEVLGDLVAARVRVLRQQRGGHHEETGGAE